MAARLAASLMTTGGKTNLFIQCCFTSERPKSLGYPFFAELFCPSLTPKSQADIEVSLQEIGLDLLPWRGGARRLSATANEYSDRAAQKMVLTTFLAKFRGGQLLTRCFRNSETCCPRNHETSDGAAQR